MEYTITTLAEIIPALERLEAMARSRSSNAARRLDASFHSGEGAGLRAAIDIIQRTRIVPAEPPAAA